MPFISTLRTQSHQLIVSFITYVELDLIKALQDLSLRLSCVNNLPLILAKEKIMFFAILCYHSTCKHLVRRNFIYKSISINAIGKYASDPCPGDWV